VLPLGLGGLGGEEEEAWCCKEASVTILTPFYTLIYAILAILTPFERHFNAVLTRFVVDRSVTPELERHAKRARAVAQWTMWHRPAKAEPASGPRQATPGSWARREAQRGLFAGNEGQFGLLR